MIPRVRTIPVSRLVKIQQARSGSESLAFAPVRHARAQILTSPRGSSLQPLRCRALSTSLPRPQDRPIQQDPQIPSTGPQNPVNAPSAKSQPKKPRRRLFLFAATFLVLGAAAGSALRLVIQPPTPPDPDTEEDAFTIDVLRRQAAQLRIVRELATDPAWESWDAYEGLGPAHRRQHIMAGALRGARGVGAFHRVFHNASTGELVTVVHFGAALAGWPGVVHGGLLATILDESCGRAAFKTWDGASGVTARLGVKYEAATWANRFYVVRARVRDENDLSESERGKRHYKVFVDATVEDAESGKRTVAANAVFVGGQGKGTGLKSNSTSGKPSWSDASAWAGRF